MSPLRAVRAYSRTVEPTSGLSILSQLSDGKLAADTIASALNLTGTKNVGNESRVIALYAIALLAALRRQEPA